LKTLRISDRASPVPFRHQNLPQQQIFKSKSGHSIKGLEL
jgi:hypothetical protein